MKTWCILLIPVLLACEKKSPTPYSELTFEGETKVTVQGYSDDLMEPFLSRDGNTLLFNNSNDPAVNTNLHWATAVDNTTFKYNGEIAGVCRRYLSQTDQQRLSALESPQR